MGGRTDLSGWISFELLWDGLGQQTALMFGRAAASSMVWAVTATALHWILQISGLVRLLSLPPALIFAGPPLLKILAKKVEFMEGLAPNMPIRIAESLAGGHDPLMSLIILLPAHCLGSIIGVTFVGYLVPLPEPIDYDDPVDILWWRAVGLEAGLTMLFVLGYHVVPEVLRLNKIPGTILLYCICSLPLMLVGVPDKGPIFCPEYLYTLWYVHKKTDPNCVMQSAHLIGPILGGLVAGIIMSKFFPENLR
mmetsp:Transcript_1326/g.1762  ORF Transcript_1326/g.1762 Transcript_1326/m.1762 type:complete len:251 (-) Transcript_1326:250-1002(-)